MNDHEYEQFQSAMKQERIEEKHHRWAEEDACRKRSLDTQYSPRSIEVRDSWAAYDKKAATNGMKAGLLIGFLWAISQDGDWEMGVIWAVVGGALGSGLGLWKYVATLIIALVVAALGSVGKLHYVSNLR